MFAVEMGSDLTVGCERSGVYPVRTMLIEIFSPPIFGKCSVTRFIFSVCTTNAMKVSSLSKIQRRFTIPLVELLLGSTVVDKGERIECQKRVNDTHYY